jgi:glycosyltransferase involved in cell wall biosynthesis
MTPAPRAARPRFSVVIPAFNESAYLVDCLRSLAAQDFPGPVEVIVVDNNSTDDTAAIARSMGATVVTEERPGVCFARQRGTEVACGEVIVSTDADTTFDRGWLSRIDLAFVRNPTSVAVAGPCRFADGPWWASVYPTLLFGMVHLLYLATGRVCYVTATNTAFRKSAWTGYDTRLTQGGDELDLLRRLRARGRVVFDLGNPTLTSARRLNRGMLYNVAVTLVFYYLLGYGLNRLAHRPLVGTAPVFRGSGSSPHRRWVGGALAACVLVLMTLLIGDLAFDLVALV